MLKAALFAGLVVNFSFFVLHSQTVVSDNWQGLQVEYTTAGFSIESIDDYAVLSLEGSMPAGEVGSPSLPVFSTLIEVPLCKGFEVKVTGDEYDTIQLDLPVFPMQAPRSKSDTVRHPLSVNTKVYATDAWLGGGTTIEAIGIARDRRLARLQFCPVNYNPAKGMLAICRKATVTVYYVGADREATMEMYERYHSPAFASGAMTLNSLYPKSVRTSAPVRYLIVAHSMFRGQMDDFVQWKRRKGFITDIVYTDDPTVGTTTSSIQAYIQSQYTNATATSPAPTYLLLVGDVAQIPAFDGTTQNSHITDLYYTTWTSGDHLPDCYCGRFSAQNISQLQPQIDKTLMYEQYTFADPTFLDRAVMVAGVDGGNSGDYGYTHADPAMDYAITNYINGAHGWTQVMYFKNNTSIVPTGSNVTVGSSASSNAATVRNYYNQGAGWVNYSAHGGSTGWGTPSFGNSHVNSMTNTQKFGLFIGNCCQTNMFGESTCFGEALLRKGNYCGAVGYIGGSDYTYWGEDFYWAVGVRSGIGPTMSMAYSSSYLGAYDRLCHTHGEAYTQWAQSQGSLMMMGNMAVESSTSGLKHYYWEIYHLMGDPSVMTYMTQADTMAVSMQPTLVYGTATMTVTAVPYAYVALTDTATHTLQAAAFADASGNATLTLPAAMPVGGYELAVSAQQYRTAFRQVSMVQPAGAFPMVTAMTPAVLTAGDTAALDVVIENIGNATAYNIVAHFSVTNPNILLSVDSLTVDSLTAGAQVLLAGALQAVVAPTAADELTVPVSVWTDWSGAGLSAASTRLITVHAPILQLSITPDILSLQPGGSMQVTATIANTGHAALPTCTIALTSPTMLVEVSPEVTLPTLQPGGEAQAQFTLQVSSAMPAEVTVPLTLHSPLTALCSLYIGQPWCETFEEGYHLVGWGNGGNLPWETIELLPTQGGSDPQDGGVSTAWQGTWCARSAHGLGHDQTSELTLAATFPVADSIRFRYAVSSEGGYDKFHFYLDTAELVTASGDREWTEAVFPVAAGTHTLRFAYTKDYSVSNGQDCAWIDMLSLPHTVHPATFSSTDLCQGQPAVSHGDTVPTAQPGSFTLVFAGSTVAIEDYTVHPAVYTVDTVETCDSYTWHGAEYTQSCNIVSAYNSTYGCDSVSGLMLTIHHSTNETLTVDGCDSVSWNGVLYTSPANLYGSYTDIHGCDSVVTIQIRIHSAVFTTDSVTVTQAYEWNGETYTESGEYTMVLSSEHGCDSTVTLVLTIEPAGVTSGQWPVSGQLEVWPNPTVGMLTFSHKVDECRVYDVTGRLVKVENGEGITLHSPLSTLDLSSLPQGVYLLRVTTAEGTAALRVVKE